MNNRSSKKRGIERVALQNNDQFCVTSSGKADCLALMEFLPTPVVVHCGQRIVYANTAAKRIFAVPDNKDLTGRNIIDFVHPDYREAVLERIKLVTEGKGSVPPAEERLLRIDGSEMIAVVSTLPFIFDGEKGVLISIDDITMARESEEKQKRAYEQAMIYAKELNHKISELDKSRTEMKKLSMAIEHSVNIVFITDREGKIEYVNPKFEEVTGYTSSDAVGRKPSLLKSGDTSEEEYRELWKTIASGGTWRGMYKNRKKNGEFYWCTSVIMPINDRKGRVTNYIALQEDITERMSVARSIDRLSGYDPLTGLFNRSHFIADVERQIARLYSCGDTGIVLLIDIDRFQTFNDTFGYKCGDELLKNVACFVRSFVEKSRTVTGDYRRRGWALGRLSSDEFALFLPSLDNVEGMFFAEELRQGIEALVYPDTTIHITVSIGMAEYPSDGNNSRELLPSANVAMMRAKALGRNRVYLSRPEDRGIERVHKRLEWKEKILTALENDSFIPYFQPLLNLKDNVIDHYEALARMKQDGGEIAMPSRFVDIAEDFGLIRSIDRSIMEKAMMVQADMEKKGSSLTIAMNLSGKDIGDRELLSDIRASILSTGANPGRLEFEITETAAINDMNDAISLIDALKEIGCTFALDDFGVGFTSFTYLKEMEVDYIKIDGSFIRRLHENKNDQLFVKAMVDVAEGMGIKTIAEFVETGETLEILRSFGVDFAQGYFIGRPMPEIS